ncbi:nuclear transport factor 2 family protein [Fibrella aquatilis]|uniref:Nuclear transport factor 2 family protein n=1 Tax=Fibrella aquatilis TaxID=2817059 RepID=A0A939K0B2_9BACT|nr:nuclear transport factor 2 family protein [Fibrella aquatilis]MBO0931811.1 nuclear transport factor 2 family protein [Fibrella aquatilis]
MKNIPTTTASLTIALVVTVMTSNQSTAQTTAQPAVQQASAGTLDNSPAQLAKAFLTAVQQGDHTVPKALLHPNVKWHQPGKHRFAGLKVSSAAVFQMVGAMSEASTKTLRLAEVKSITVHGNQVACLINWKAVMEGGGGVLDVDNIDVYTIQDGKIVEARIFSADLAQEDNFWGW